MRDLHKAVAVVIACLVAACGILAAAALRNRPRLTSGEVLAAARLAVEEAVEEAISSGGLDDSESHLRSRISSIIAAGSQSSADVRIVRRNDFDRFAAFYFDIVAGEIQVRFWLEGVRDPLLAIRLGLDWRWREDPHHPYESHGGSSTLADCLTNHYFHLADDGPDFFARLENKTESPHHYGVEALLVVDGELAVDHLYLGGKGKIDDAHRRLYGLP